MKQFFIAAVLAAMVGGLSMIAISNVEACTTTLQAEGLPAHLAAFLGWGIAICLYACSAALGLLPRAGKAGCYAVMLLFSVWGCYTWHVTFKLKLADSNQEEAAQKLSTWKGEQAAYNEREAERQQAESEQARLSALCAASAQKCASLVQTLGNKRTELSSERGNGGNGPTTASIEAEIARLEVRLADAEQVNNTQQAALAAVVVPAALVEPAKPDSLSRVRSTHEQLAKATIPQAAETLLAWLVGVMLVALLSAINGGKEVAAAQETLAAITSDIERMQDAHLAEMQKAEAIQAEMDDLNAGAQKARMESTQAAHMVQQAEARLRTLEAESEQKSEQVAQAVAQHAAVERADDEDAAFIAACNDCRKKDGSINKAAVARSTGIERTKVYRRIKELGLDKVVQLAAERKEA